MSDRAPRAAAHPSRRRTPWWRIVVALVVALAVQVPFVVGFRLALLGGANGANPEPEPTPSIEDEPQLVAVTEEEAPAPLEREPELEPEPQPEPEQEQEPDAAPLVELVVPDPVETVTPQPEAEPPPPPPDEDVNRLAVAQAESNDVEPVETNHRADRANTVAEETIAANTTLRDPGAPETWGDDDAPEGDDAGSETMEHGEDAPAEPEAVAEQSEQVDGAPDAESLEQPTPRPDDVEPMVAALEPDPVPDVEPVEAVEPTPTPDPAEVAPPPGTEGNEPPRRSGLSLQAQLEQAREAVEGNPDAAEAVANLATPSADDWVEVFGARDAQDRIRLEREAREASLVGDHRGEYERTQAALENHGVQARTGTETHLNARADSTAGYIHHLHSFIHPEWESYLLRLETTLGPGSVMADPDLHTRLEWVIGADGHVENVALVETSGQILFDMEAINLLYRLDPVRPPPVELRSPDGNTYVHWSFRRDQRMCFTGGASVRFVGATEFGDEPASAPL